MSEKMTSLFLFSILFNLFFSVYGYAFTNFPGEWTENPDLDIAIGIDDLYAIGITFTNATSLNITFGEDPLLIEREGGVPLKIDWSSHPLKGDYFQILIQSPIERYLDTWYLPDSLDLWMGPDDDFYMFIWNSSLVSLYEPDHDWIRGLGGADFTFFLSPTHADTGNITRAVYETGILTLTYGTPISLTGQDEISVKNFILWYLNTITGADNYGLPDSLIWLMRIIFTLNVIAGVFTLKELSRL